MKQKKSGIVVGLVLTFFSLGSMADHLPPEKLGNLNSLEKIYLKVRNRYNGCILKVTLTQEKKGTAERWLYRVRLQDPNGHVLVLRFDAESLGRVDVR